MKTSEKKKVQSECERLLIDVFGAIPANEAHKDSCFILETPIGRARLTLDTTCKSKVMSLFVNFYEQPAIAKAVLGHWKQNLHEYDTPNFSGYAQEHLTATLEKMKNSDAWMYLECLDAFKQYYGLHSAISKDSSDVIQALSEKTAFSQDWIRSNVGTLMALRLTISNQMGV